MVQGVCIAVVWHCGSVVWETSRGATLAIVRGITHHTAPRLSGGQRGGGAGGAWGAWGGMGGQRTLGPNFHLGEASALGRPRLPLHTNTNQHHTQSHLCSKTSTQYLYCNIEGHLYDSRCRYKLYHFLTDLWWTQCTCFNTRSSSVAYHCIHVKHTLA